MNSKNRLIRSIAIIGILVMVIVTILPGCNFIGQAGNDSGEPLVDDAGNELCCPVCKSIDISGPDGEGYYSCNECSQKWQYNDTQLDVVDDAGNVVDTMDSSAGYVSNGGSYNGGSTGGNGGSTGGNSGSTGGSTGGNGGSTGGSTGGNGGSTGGNGGSTGGNGGSTGGNGGSTGGNGGSTGGNGGSTGGGSVTYTTNKNTSDQVKDNLKKISNAMTNLDKSVEIIYDENTQSYTVKSKDGTDTGLFGYKYSTKDKIFYTAEDSWQRNFGFNEVYDDAAAVGFMTYNTFRVYFDYNKNGTQKEDLEWMIQFWKGQYGYAFVGSEVGVYTRAKGSGNGSTHYECADDDHKFYMTMDVYRQNPDNPNKYDHLFTRSRCNTWWCTGFVPGTLGFAQVNVPDEGGTAKLKVDVKMEFFDEEMAQAFINGLKNVKYLENNSAVSGTKRLVTFKECANETEYRNSAESNKFCLCANGKHVRVTYR